MAVATVFAAAVAACAAPSTGGNMMGGVAAQPTGAAMMSTRSAAMTDPGSAAMMLPGSAVMTSPGVPRPGGAGMMFGGMPGYHFSTPSCSAPTTLPGTVVTVRLGDMGMTQMMGGTAPLGVHMMLFATPATISAGRVSFVAANIGWRTHELVVLPLAAGSSAGQRSSGANGKVGESGSLGEASADCASGSGEGITVGKAGWVTLNLAAGHYELVCNLANHYADGMRQELIVT